MLARVLLAIAVVAFGLPATVMAADCAGLVRGPRGVVTQVTDGDSVVLDNGLVIRLVGMQAPKLPKGREDFAPWPKAAEARAALEALVLSRHVTLRYGGARLDRHGRALGQLFVEGPDAVWVQERMISQGWARVYSFPDNRKCVAELLAAEGRARMMRLGIWADPFYTVRRADRPDSLAGRLGQYELVEGRVLLADEVSGRVFLNFGRYWKEDVTAVIDSRARRLFRDFGLDPLQLGGALVRVRGFVDDNDGPRIEVTHPEQIEILAQR